jgi:AraC-like DNA-binding protein
MKTGQGYGEGLARRVLFEEQAIVTHVLKTTDMAVTETRCHAPTEEMSGSFRSEDSFLVTLTLRDYPNREYWEDGRFHSVSDIRTGQTCIHDLKRDPIARLDKPFHVIFYYLPRSALDAIADDAEAPRISDLDHNPLGIDDATVRHLSDAMLPALSHSDQANQLFLDHALLALGAHIARTYGGMKPLSPPIRGGLAVWQERRAKELLSVNLKGNIPLKEVAQECHLSVSHFSRAFRRSVGTAPHNWLLMHRIEIAKEKLRDRRLSLLDVAIACGFSDQSHLTRVFSRIVGVSPGVWRRAIDGR